MTSTIAEDSVATGGHVDIIDDDEAICKSLAELLTFAGYQVRTWTSAEVFLNNLPQAAPAVIITDMRMNGMTGVEMHETLKTMGRTIPVIYMSGESSVPQSVKAMKLGAVDFLSKPFTRENILEAVIAGLEKDRVQLRELIEQRRLVEASKSLAPREREVMKLLMKGFSNSEIVEALGISLPTAKQYKTQIMQKLGVRSLSQLMQFGKIDHQ